MSNSSEKHISKKSGLFLFIGVTCLILALLLLLVTILFLRRQNRIFVTSLPQTPIKIDQPISIGVVDMHISKIKTTDGKQPFIAQPGTQYILLSMTIKNRSDQPIQVLPTTDTYVKDSEGNVSYLSPYVLENPLRAGELLPGETIIGDVSYLVKKSGVKKFYADSSWSGTVVPFALN